MASNFSPTPSETSLVSQIFAKADPQKLGALTGDVAVSIFGGAKLPPTVLGEIWNIADEDNKGWLPKKGVAIAVRLIGWAQKGEKVNVSLLSRPGPLAVIEGISVVSQQNTGMSIPKSPPPGFPPLTPQDRKKFYDMFSKYGAQNGIISGDKARDIFLKSKLPNDKLMQIWNLADTQDRGALDATDFAIGMYFIQRLMSGQISFVPTTLPPGLYQQAGGAGATAPSSIISHLSGNSGSFSPTSATFPSMRGQVQPQITGQSQRLQPDHTGFSPQPRIPALPARTNVASTIGTSAFGFHTNGQTPHWDVTAAEKSASDTYFDSLDTQKRGYIEGDVAVPFMLESKLPEEDLAHIWDLADMENNGRLTRDGFAVAMHLIQKKLAGGNIPAILPNSLKPPSMRGANTSSFSVASQPPSELPKDLFSFDDTPPASASPQSSGVFPPVPSQQTGPSLANYPSSTTIKAAPSDPFNSSSVNSLPHRNFLEDEDEKEHKSPPLHDHSAEIGNLTIQLNSTNKSLETAKAERSTVEQSLATQTSQLTALQTQLSSAKAAYETESKLLATLRERHSAQVADIQKTREELIRAESDLSAIKVEKTEVEGSFLRDKEETRDLQRRMLETNKQVEIIKAEIEKFKKEAKQQKGLLAIARKQLSTKEAEKAKVNKDLEDAQEDLSSVQKEKDEVEAELEKASVPTTVPNAFDRTFSADSTNFAASQPLPETPDPSSPTPKRNNPFDRLTLASPTPAPSAQLALSSIPGDPNAPAASDTNSISHFDASLENDFFNAFASSNGNKNGQEGNGLPQTTPEKNRPTSTISSDSPTTPAGSEHFVTPPTTGQGFSQTASPAPPSVSGTPGRVNSTDEIASHFPTIENIFSGQPESNKDTQETDISTQLKELDVAESDSDDSDDDVPLAISAAKDTKKPPASTPPNETHTAGETPFDKIFTVDSTTAPAPPAHSQLATEQNSQPINPTFQSSGSFESNSLSTEPTIALPAVGNNPPGVTPGVNAFDEAMGKIPASSAPQPKFSFDTAFDDNFDFASAAEATKNTASETNGRKPEETKFDDVFSSDFTKQPNVASPISDFPLPGQSFHAKKEVDTPKPKPGIFEDTFAGFDSAPSLKLDGQFSTPQKNGEPPVSNQVASASPLQATPRSVSSNSHQISNRSFSPPPPREATPPPRITSPKPRISTSSSKDAHEKVKEQQPKHSKSILRLPFGKKKKTQDVPAPAPSQLLSPPREEPPRINTPAYEDDVDAVKQLTSMGFSRGQAVEALEKYGYDVQRAANSLVTGQ